MFGKLKDKLKGALSIFSKKTEEEAEVKEEVVEKEVEVETTKEVVQKTSKEESVEQVDEAAKDPVENKEVEVSEESKVESDAKSSEEMRDFVDENNKVIGQAPRSRVRKELLAHRGVMVFFRNSKNQIYINKRVKSKQFYPEYYETVFGGGVHAGEQYLQAALRELEEETNLEDLEIAFLFEDRYKSDIQNVFYQAFECVSEDVPKPNESEIESGRFVSLDELEKLMVSEKFTPGSIQAYDKYKEILKEREDEKEVLVEAKEEVAEKVQEVFQEEKVVEKEPVKVVKEPVVEKLPEPEVVEPVQEVEKSVEPEVVVEEAIVEEVEEAEVEEAPVKKSFFKRITETLTTKKISAEKFEELFWELEIALLENNVSVKVIERIKEDLKVELVDKPLPRNVLKKIEETLELSIRAIVNQDPINLLGRIKEKNSKSTDTKYETYVITFFGINGSGKTTSIAKLTHYLQAQGLSVVLAAGDTFRAAAIQQLGEHAKKLDVKMIAHDYGSDSAAVAFDAISYAQKNKINVVLVDTAGRLHSNNNLMQELEKILRVAPADLKVFVGESITGNDCVEQAQVYDEKLGVDGIILTKADIDEQGGAPLSISYVLKKPILFL